MFAIIIYSSQASELFIWLSVNKIQAQQTKVSSFIKLVVDHVVFLIDWTYMDTGVTILQITGAEVLEEYQCENSGKVCS